MKTWKSKLIVNAARMAFKVGPYIWGYYQIKHYILRYLGKLGEIVEGIPLIGPFLEDKFNSYSIQNPVLDQLSALGERRIEISNDLSKEAKMEKKKKKFSFFKVILFLGILVTLAIFLLDKLLPKPYDEDDLDDAWKDDDEWNDDIEDEEEDDEERPMAADGAYDVNKEDAEEEAEEEEAKESDKDA